MMMNKKVIITKSIQSNRFVVLCLQNGPFYFLFGFFVALVSIEMPLCYSELDIQHIYMGLMWKLLILIKSNVINATVRIKSETK